MGKKHTLAGQEGLYAPALPGALAKGLLFLSLLLLYAATPLQAQSQQVTACAGEVRTFYADLPGSIPSECGGPVTYSWYKPANAVLVGGGTSSSSFMSLRWDSPGSGLVSVSATTSPGTGGGGGEPPMIEAIAAMEEASASYTYPDNPGTPSCPSRYVSYSVTIVQAQEGWVDAPPAICPATPFALSYRGSTGVTRVDWYRYQGGSWAFVEGSTMAGASFAIQVPGIAAATQYRAIAYKVCGPSAPREVTVQVSPPAAAVAGVAVGSRDVPMGDNQGTITLADYAGQVAKWQLSRDRGVTWSDMGSAGEAEINYGGLVATTYYRAQVAGTCGGNSAFSEPAIVTVDNLNWIHTRAFGPAGAVTAEGRSYFGGNGQAVQSLSMDVERGHLLASEPLLGRYGQAVGQTLPAPVENRYFGFVPGFVTANGGQPYNHRHFDALAEGQTLLTDAGQTVTNPVGVDQDRPNTLGWYYSANNTLEPLVGTTAFPYGRTEAYNDGSGEVRRSSGPGDALRLGAGHELVSGTFAVTSELDHYLAVRGKFFPDAGANPTTLAGQATMQVGVDSDGKQSVSFTDKSGQTLATARPGNWHYATGTASVAKRRYILSFPDPEYYGELGELNTYAITGSGSIIAYDHRPSQVYAGSPAGYNNLMTHNTIVSDKPFSVKITYNSNGTLVTGLDVQSQVMLDPIREGEYTQEVHLFPLLQQTAVTISGGSYRLHNTVTEQVWENTRPSSLPAGFYKLEATSAIPVTIAYTNGFGDISYSFYNQLGQSLAQIAPKGMESLFPQSNINNYPAAASLPFTTRYEYDARGRLVKLTEPDAGFTEYVYRNDGKIRFSQNAGQRANGRYSYTNYDEMGRAVESGEYQPGSGGISFARHSDAWFPSSSMAGILENEQPYVSETLRGGLANGTFRDWSRTHYDLPDGGHGLGGQAQDFLYGAVSWTESFSGARTWYSYDDQGRLAWSVQQLPGMIDKKMVAYTYTLTGQVTQVAYQKGKADAFFHHYAYDADGRLKEVHTSLDGANKTLQAKYLYYLHGPLKRVELAGNLQGVDYVYTVQGWLKGMNHADKALDPGKDSPASGGNGFQKDLFGMTLDYFSGDYQSRQLAAGTSNTDLGSGYTDQFSGLIKSQSWQSSLQADAYSFAYKYDQRNQLLEANTGRRIGANFVALGGALGERVGNATTPAYDANGNIQRLSRTNLANTLTADYGYSYLTGTNKLGSVTQGGQQVMGYAYDDLGQLSRQTDEKGTRFMAYDVSGKVTGVYEGTGGALDMGKPVVTFTYDEKGQRVRKVSYDPAAGYTAKLTTWYVNDASGNPLGVYEQEEGSASVALTEAPIYGSGRLGLYRQTSYGPDFQYELTDHLGNVRVMFRRPEFVTKTASMEDLASGQEEQDFQNLARTRYPGGNEFARSGTKSAKLNAGLNEPVGPLYTFSVQAGDSVRAMAFAKYKTQSNGTWFDIGAFLSSAFALQFVAPWQPTNPGEAPDGEPRSWVPYAGLGAYLSSDLLGRMGKDGLPAAFLRYIAYDQEGQYVSDGEMPLTAAGENTWQELKLEYEATQAGFVEVFVGNLSYKDVYFDDISVRHGRGMVVQEGHSYAYGQPMEELQYLNGALKRYRYGLQGQFAEKDEETGWDAFELRMYDSRIGRWTGTDPYGQFSSPYVGMGNNPVNGVDPDGGFVSPIFSSRSGKYLGNDSEGFSGEILFMDDANYDFLSIGNTPIDHTIAKLNSFDIRSVDYGVATNALNFVMQATPGIDFSNLFNGKLSYYDYHTKGNKTFQLNFGHTDAWNDYAVWNLADDGSFKITLGSSGLSLFRTVENAQNGLAVHEYLGHGVKKFRGESLHFKAYDLMMNHPTYENTTADYKLIIKDNYNSLPKR